MNNYTRIGLEIGELVDRKNAAYGSSFAKAGEFLQLLWPDGLTPDRYDDALLMARIFDKQMRIATDRDAFGESPYRDIAGYGLLGAELHKQKEGDAPCGSVRADAETKPKATPASAPASASPGTTTSERPQSGTHFGDKCWLPPANCLPNEESKDVSAPSATANASSEEYGLFFTQLASSRDVWLNRNQTGDCAFCGEQLEGPATTRRELAAAVVVKLHSWCFSSFRNEVDAVGRGL